MDLPDFSKDQKFIALREAMGITPENSVPCTPDNWVEDRFTYLKHMKNVYEMLADRMEMMSGDSKESIADLNMWKDADDPIFDPEEQKQIRAVETLLKNWRVK